MKIDICEINRIIEEEVEFAKEINPIMALGMNHVKRMLNEYNDSLEIKGVI